MWFSVITPFVFLKLNILTELQGKVTQLLPVNTIFQTTDNILLIKVSSIHLSRVQEACLVPGNTEAANCRTLLLGTSNW